MLSASPCLEGWNGIVSTNDGKEQACNAASSWSGRFNVGSERQQDARDARNTL